MVLSIKNVKFDGVEIAKQAGYDLKANEYGKMVNVITKDTSEQFGIEPIGVKGYYVPILSRNLTEEEEREALKLIIKRRNIYRDMLKERSDKLKPSYTSLSIKSLEEKVSYHDSWISKIKGNPGNNRVDIVAHVPVNEVANRVIRAGESINLMDMDDFNLRCYGNELFTILGAAESRDLANKLIEEAKTSDEVISEIYIQHTVERKVICANIIKIIEKGTDTPEYDYVGKTKAIVYEVAVDWNSNDMMAVDITEAIDNTVLVVAGHVFNGVVTDYNRSLVSESISVNKATVTDRVKHLSARVDLISTAYIDCDTDRSKCISSMDFGLSIINHKMYESIKSRVKLNNLLIPEGMDLSASFKAKYI